MQYWYQRWVWGSNLCFITTAFRYINAFADWMCVSMIAVSRCITLSKPDLAEKLFGRRNGKLIILLVWIYANLLILPIYTEVSPEVNVRSMSWGDVLLTRSVIRQLILQLLKIVGLYFNCR